MRDLRADGVGTLIGGIFNTFPYTSFSQNVGLVGVTDVKSRFVTAAGGLILLVLGLTPKMTAVVDAMPMVVLGGAGIVMFGMVAATGIRILAGVDFQAQRQNLFVIAISVGVGMIPLVAPGFFHHKPRALQPLLGSGILLAAIAAVLLNLLFNTVSSEAEARSRSAGAAGAAEHVCPTGRSLARFRAAGSGRGLTGQEADAPATRRKARGRGRFRPSDAGRVSPAGGRQPGEHGGRLGAVAALRPIRRFAATT